MCGAILHIGLFRLPKLTLPWESRRIEAQSWADAVLFTRSVSPPRTQGLIFRRFTGIRLFRKSPGVLFQATTTIFGQLPNRILDNYFLFAHSCSLFPLGLKNMQISTFAINGVPGTRSQRFLRESYALATRPQYCGRGKSLGYGTFARRIRSKSLIGAPYCGGALFF